MIMAMRVIRASTPAIRKAWLDTNQTLSQAAEALDMSVDALQDHARRLGLPARKTGRSDVIRPHQEAEFRTMWTLGLSLRSIGQYFGGSYTAARNAALRMELPMRERAFRPSMTLDEYRERRLAALMALSVDRRHRP